jgi:monothiol glutaredoxin
MDHPRKKEIEEFIHSKHVAIYMKGTPDFPMCGFSGQTIQVLKASGVEPSDLAAFNVLEDEEMRGLIKEYTEWPTVPQVFIGGKFIGGCDLAMEMYQRGELQALLQK